MSIISLFKTSINSLKSHKLRAFLTMLGIIIGISSVVTILSIGNGLKKEVLSSSEDTSANKINISFTPDNYDVDISLIEPFTDSDMYSIQDVDGVQKVEASSDSMMGIGGTFKAVSYFDKASTIMLDTYENKNLKIQYGSGFDKSQKDGDFIVLEKNSAKELFSNPKDAIGKGITIDGNNYEVIGVLADSSGFNIMGNSNYVSQESMKRLTANSTISAIDVYIKPGYNSKKVFNEVNSLLTSRHQDLQGTYKLQDPQEITKAFEKIIGGVTAFIAFISGISLFVGGIGVMNIMYVSVSERKREIGIRRAIGAKPKTVLLQFLIEAMMVTGIGGLIGILLGYGLAKIVGCFLPFPPVLSVGCFTGATITSVLVGIIFGIVPARNAAKMDPIKAIYQ